MKTGAMQWNELAGRKLFAESIDKWGLPADGLWSSPIVLVFHEPEECQVEIYIATFRVLADDRIERRRVGIVLPERDYHARAKQGLDGLKSDLQGQLIAKLLAE